jgi:hypothetical protein
VTIAQGVGSSSNGASEGRLALPKPDPVSGIGHFKNGPP